MCVCVCVSIQVAVVQAELGEVKKLDLVAKLQAERINRGRCAGACCVPPMFELWDWQWRERVREASRTLLTLACVA